MVQRIIKIAIAGLILLLCTGTSAFTTVNESLSQFVIYFEGANEIDKNVTVTIDRLELISDEGTFSFQPLVKQISSISHANRQFLFLEELIEPYKYTKLKLYFSQIEVVAERAKIYPEIDSNGYALEFDLSFSSGATTVLFLGWKAQNDYYTDNIYQAIFYRNYKSIPPIGSVYFVSNEKSNNISVIDRDEYKVINVVRAGTGPTEMVYSPFNNQLIVSNTKSNSLSIIDASVNRLIKSIIRDYSDETIKMLLSPDQLTLFLLNARSNTLTSFDLNSFQEKERVYLDFTPLDMALHELSGNIYITYEFSREISLYNIYSRQLVTSYQLPYEASAVAVNNRKEIIYYAQPTQRSVSSFSPTDGSAASTINICGSPLDLVYSTTLQMLYASVPECKEIVFIKPSQNIEIGSIVTTEKPGRIAVDNRNRQLVVPLADANKIVVYNTHNRQKTAEIEVGKSPYMVLIP